MIIELTDSNGNRISVNAKSINNFVKNNVVIGHSESVNVGAVKKEEILIDIAPCTFGDAFDDTFKQ